MNPCVLIVNYAFQLVQYSLFQLFQVVFDIRIGIIGGDLLGLVLTSKLLDLNLEYDITIFEERAEIGFPCLGSGLLINSNSYFEMLLKWIPEPTNSLYQIVNDNYVFRRDWLEKDLAISLAKKNIDIHVRSPVKEFSSSSISYVESGVSQCWNGDLVIDCRNSHNSSNYFGLITSFEIIDSISRPDGTWESWHNELPTDVSFLQILEPYSNEKKKNSIDYVFISSSNILAELDLS